MRTNRLRINEKPMPYNGSMDTIIYLFQSKEEENFLTEKWQESDYCLIRLGIPSLLWRNIQRLEADSGEHAAEVQTRKRRDRESSAVPDKMQEKMLKNSAGKKSQNRNCQINNSQAKNIMIKNARMKSGSTIDGFTKIGLAQADLAEGAATYRSEEVGKKRRGILSIFKKMFLQDEGDRSSSGKQVTDENREEDRKIFTLLKQVQELQVCLCVAR